MLSFLLASMICIIAPGPDNIMVLSTGISSGRRAGISFAIGCGLGCITHALWAALGISALIMKSAIAFQIFKYVGAGYLFYLAYSAFRSGSLQTNTPANQLKRIVEPSFTYIRRGFLANALNPKVAIFFLAFLPQFVSADSSNIPLQILVFGLIFGLMVAVLFSVLGIFSGSVGLWLNGQPSAGKWLDRFAGTVFVGLGLRLIVASNQ